MTKIAVNVFELFAKIGLNDEDYKKKLDDSESKTEKFAKKLKSGLASAAKIGGAAIGAAASAVAALTKASVENYAEYEQLVGGAELMFGKAYDKVAENAKNAYKTVQMSQNEYLQQVNGFATGLKSALKGNETAAADLAHKIVQAEADVIAATGNTAENVQNAFNGIMKSNFTMLDNLQIGITPTKEGFQEVIDKVNAWNKTQGEATNYQMGNLADMQAALVDYVDMVGMKGYAEQEAAHTIQGSLASTKAAYSNLLTGMADDNANFEELVNGLVTSIAGDGTEDNPGLIKNIIPRVQAALGGVASLVTSLAPVIGEQLPGLFTALVPGVLEGAMSIISALGSALPGIFDSISATLITMGADLTAKLGEGMSSGSTLTQIVQSAMTLIAVLATTLLEQAPTIMKSAIDIIRTLAFGLADAIPMMLPTIVDVVVEIAKMLTEPSTLSELLKAGLDIILELGTGLADATPQLVDAAVQVITNLVDYLVNPENITQVIAVALELIIALGGGLISAIPSLVKSVGEIILAIVDNFREQDWGKLGDDLVAGFKGGIQNAWANLKTWFTGLFDDLIDVAKKILGIASPSKEFKKIGKFVDEGLEKGITENSGKVTEAMEKIVEKTKKTFDNIQEYFSNSMDIAEAEFELWGETEGINATNTERAIKKIETLNEQLTAQEKIVNEAAKAYKKIASVYGENSVEASNFKKTLIEEQKEYRNLQNELADTEATYKKMQDSQNHWSRIAIDAVEKVADAVKSAFDDLRSYYDTTMDIAELEYEMWELTEGIGASETEKMAKKLEMLNKQTADQKNVVEESNKAYAEMVKLYGETSAEAMAYKKVLLEEQVEYQKMQNELAETNKSYEELTERQKTWATVAIDAVRRVANAIKDSTQTADSAVAQQQEKSNRDIGDRIGELVNLFKSGKAKTNVTNTRDFRSVSYG